MPDRALPYGLHLIEDDDIAAVTAVLRSGMLAQGPAVAAFEAAFADAVRAPRAVACSSGTAALQLALRALDIGPGDLCVVPAITFLSTATAALLNGAEVVLADVDPLTGLMTADTAREAAGRAGRPVKALLPVHLGGRIADMPAIAAAAAQLGAVVVEDGCHAPGSHSDADGYVGECRHSAAATFSFHPVKTIACGEGGMVTTLDSVLADRIRRLRNHGVTRDAAMMTDPALSFDHESQPNPWSYEQLELGFNFRMTDIEAALGRSQLGKLDRFIAARQRLTALYDRLLAPLAPRVRPVRAATGQFVSPHLYTVLIDFQGLEGGRAALMRRLAARGIGTQVHYIPLYRQPYFVARHGVQRLPGAESWYARTLTLPLFPAMTPADVERVVEELSLALGPH